MLRVKNPKASVKFYEFLGMKQVNKVRVTACLMVDGFLTMPSV